jgi:hypothetical protein
MIKLSKSPPRGFKLLQLEKAGKLKMELFIVFKMLRAEGVTDSDILSWWNLSNKEQHEIIQKDIMLIKSFTKTFIKKVNHRLDEIYSFMGKVFPQFIRYSSKMDISETSPLPYELKKRVREYFELRSIEELNIIKANSENFPNMNAYIRFMIKNKRI